MVGRTITVTDWIVAALLVFVGVGIVCVLGPKTIIKKRDNDFAFSSGWLFRAIPEIEKSGIQIKLWMPLTKLEVT